MSRPSQPIKLPSIPGPKSTLADRVRWLLDDYWKGNRKKCAEDVGVNPTYISRIATETNNSGTDLLEKLAAKPFLNTRWLLTGNGSPYLSVDTQQQTSWMLPVLNELPNGQIRQPSGVLARHFKEIDVLNYSISRCWTQLSISDDLAQCGEYGFQVGDYVLWETDPSYWKDLTIFYRRPAVVTDKKMNYPAIKVLDYHDTEDDGPHLSCADLTRSTTTTPHVREYLLKVSKDNSLHLDEISKRKRPVITPMELLFPGERRRIIAVAILGSRTY